MMVSACDSHGQKTKWWLHSNAEWDTNCMEYRIKSLKLIIFIEEHFLIHMNLISILLYIDRLLRLTLYGVHALKIM